MRRPGGGWRRHVAQRTVDGSAVGILTNGKTQFHGVQISRAMGAARHSGGMPKASTSADGVAAHLGAETVNHAWVKARRAGGVSSTSPFSRNHARPFSSVVRARRGFAQAFPASGADLASGQSCSDRGVELIRARCARRARRPVRARSSFCMRGERRVGGHACHRRSSRAAAAPAARSSRASSRRRKRSVCVGSSPRADRRCGAQRPDKRDDPSVEFFYRGPAREFAPCPCP